MGGRKGSQAKLSVQLTLYLPDMLLQALELSDWPPLSFLLRGLGLADPGSTSALLSQLNFQLDITQHRHDHVVEDVVETVSPELGLET